MGEGGMAGDGRGIAVVTGASRREGLGFEVSRQLAEAGFHVVLTARDGERARAQASELAALGLSVEGRSLDVADEASASAFADAIGRDFGAVEVLVNNAAGVFDASAPTITADVSEVQAALDINLFGVWRMVRLLEPLLRRGRHPRIVNVSSEAASFGAPMGMATRGPTLGAYAVSKA